MLSRKNLSAIVAGLSAAAALLVVPLEASGCSCVPIDPWRAYEAADAAIVGVFAGKRGPTTYVFRVEQDFKVDFGAELEVRSAEHGASCGLEARIGQRLGLFLDRDRDGWRSSLCRQASPEQIRRAAAGLPRPNGRGPIRFLVGGSFGRARVQALDGRGRTLAYGYGRGRVVAVAVCPRSRVMIEVGAERFLAVRDLRTLRIIRQLRLPLGSGDHVAAASCSRRDGRTSFVFAARGNAARILRVGRRTTTLYRGAGLDATFAGRYAYVGGVRRGIVRVDLASGRARTVAPLYVERAPAVSPDGRLLAAVTEQGTLAIVDVVRGRTRAGPRTGAATQAVWIGAKRVAWLTDSGEVLVYDTAFRRIGGFRGWTSTAAVAAGPTLVGLAYGALRAAPMPHGPARLLRDLFSRETYALAAVRGGPRAASIATLACARG